MSDPSRRVRCAIRSALVAVAVVLQGCGGGGGLTAVKGKVAIDGTPMAGGSVRFVPDKAKGNQAVNEPVGVIESDGSYTVATAGKPGAPLGWYKVTVASGDIPESSKPFAGKNKLNPRYGNPEFTDLNIEVVASPKDGAYDLKLSSK